MYINFIWCKIFMSGTLVLNGTLFHLYLTQEPIYRYKYKWLNSIYVISVITYMTAGVRVAQWVRSLDLTAHTSLSPIQRGFAPSFVSYKEGCTRLAAASDKVYQMLAQGRWFSPDTPTSSTTKTGRHDIAEILLKVALKHQISNQIYMTASFH